MVNNLTDCDKNVVIGSDLELVNFTAGCLTPSRMYMIIYDSSIAVSTSMVNLYVTEPVQDWNNKYQVGTSSYSIIPNHVIYSVTSTYERIY